MQPHPTYWSAARGAHTKLTTWTQAESDMRGGKPPELMLHRLHRRVDKVNFIQSDFGLCRERNAHPVRQIQNTQSTTHTLTQKCTHAHILSKHAQLSTQTHGVLVKDKKMGRGYSSRERHTDSSWVRERDRSWCSTAAILAVYALRSFPSCVFVDWCTRKSINTRK